MPDKHAALFKALSSRSRVKILWLLSQCEELSVDELTEHIQLAGPTVSRHLQVLRLQDLVVVRRHAQNRFYALNREQLVSKLFVFLQFLGLEMPIPVGKEGL
jgi:DNA-binding transcriptional ArsR family regulator